MATAHDLPAHLSVGASDRPDPTRAGAFLVALLPFALVAAFLLGWAAEPLLAQAARADGAATAAAERADAGLHAPYDALLRQFVRDGVVDYTGLSARRDELQGYLRALAATDPDALSRDEQAALWINAYNAFTLELMLEYLGRIDGIKDISSGKRWKHERWDVGGTRYSLDQIEHEILRPRGDARVHFALVCASVSCPDLRAEAYVGATLDAQLDDAARHFLADTSKGLRTAMESGFFGGDDPTLYLSKIFDWFEEDFEGDGQDVVDFVLRYAPAEDAAFIRRHRDDLDVDHMDYDWSLNGR